MRIRGYTCVAALMLSISGLSIAEEASVDQTRDALAKESDDADSAEVLGEAFQATEKSYTLLGRGKWTLAYGLDYALVRDQWLTLVPLTKTSGGVRIYGLAGRQNRSQRTFTNSSTFDYGIWDNPTFSFRLPLVAKCDTEMDAHAYSLDDVSVTLCWQPWAAVRGRPIITLYTTIGLPTGDSPYKTNPDKDTSIGNGYYSLGFGANMSYVTDPVISYGSPGYTWNLPMNDVCQTLANDSQLEKASPSNTINFNMGMVCALPYDVSLATSYQMAYTLKNHYHTTIGTFESSEQTSNIMNFPFGLRTSPDYVVNINASLGLTEGSPDVLLELFVPLDIKGLEIQ